MGWWQYLILVNIYLLLFYGFYVLLLRRETFFQLNRVYLVAAALLSFLIPVIQSAWVKNLFITQRVKYTIYTSPVMFYQFKPIQETYITIGQILIWVYISGIVFLIIRFIRQLIALKKLLNKPQTAAAYSFFKNIHLGDELADNSVIAAHENVHASQWHSADVLLIETVMIINWFNPVVYLYRLAVKHIHEFIADKQAIKSGISREAYALLLLSQTFNTSSHQLITPFSTQSLLKQRIIMLQKNNSRSPSLVKYCLSVPLFILMLILSSATVNNSIPVRFFNNKVEQVLLVPATSGISDAKNDNNRLNAGTDKNTSTFSKVESNKITASSSTKDTIPKSNDVIFTSVEHPPSFPGGLTAFYQYLGGNIKYPAKDREQGIQGKVYITFVVEKDGTLTDVKVALGVSPGVDTEALRVIEASPKWIPGMQGGKLVRVAYIVPISFMLQEGKSTLSVENNTGTNKENKHTPAGTWSSDKKDILKIDTGKEITEIGQYDGPNPPPLFIVDEKETPNLNKVSPNDIVSVSVLKDQSATSIYGPKAVYGVVLITTKKKNKP